MKPLLKEFAVIDKIHRVHCVMLEDIGVRRVTLIVFVEPRQIRNSAPKSTAGRGQACSSGVVGRETSRTIELGGRRSPVSITRLAALSVVTTVHIRIEMPFRRRRSLLYQIPDQNDCGYIVVSLPVGGKKTQTASSLGPALAMTKKGLMWDLTMGGLLSVEGNIRS